VPGRNFEAILRAIVAGERDPRELAALSDPRVHASQEEIAKSLEGNWRSELLFVLQPSGSDQPCVPLKAPFL